jgi:predicted permease
VRLATCIQDVSFGLRMLRKSRGFTAAAVLSLALGIGSTSAVFSVAEAELLRSWPAREPQRLAKIRAHTPQGVDAYFSYAEYQDLAEQANSLQGVLAYSRRGKLLRLSGETQFIIDDIISANYFEVLGVKAQLGRTFPLGNETAKELAVVISDDLWHRVFHQDPGLVGKQIVLTNKTYTVIGIAPRHFRGLEPLVPTDAWVTVATEESAEDLQSRGFRDFELLARLRPRATAGQAQAELDLISNRLAAAYPAFNKGRTATLISEQQRMRHALLPTFLLISAVGLVLLISSANVAGLILARSETRRQEIAVRMALGAGRGRLVEQLLTESAILAAAGGGLGLLLANGLFGLQAALLPPTEFRIGLDLRLDGTVIWFTLGVTMLAVLICGLVPALQTSKTSLIPALKSGEGTTHSARWFTLRNLMVFGEIALSVVLLTASGLLLRSFLYSSRVPLGFNAQKNLIFFDVAPSIGGYDEEGSLGFFQRLAENVGGLAGVKNVTFVRRVLLSDSGGGAMRRVSIPGIELPNGQPNILIKFDAIGPRYFETLGAHILEGRDFTATDSSKSQGVVLISAAMARRFWPGGEAVGRQIVVEGKGHQVVGVVEDAKINDVHESPEPYMYFPFAQSPTGDGTLVVETSGDPRAMVGTIRDAVYRMDKSVPVSVRTMHSLLQEAFWADRVAATFVGGLSALGLLLASVGLYGVMAFLANRRQREIGIRMALGAARSDVLRLVLTQGLMLAAIGNAIGLVTAFGTTRLMSNLLYGVRPNDPVAFASSAAIVVLISLVATSIPALRAARADPLIALHCE